ncbi:MAG TPA: hypothetical protein DCM28_18845 [Phycisphaerales bacterium]|nr:hypothetical protein [Phycisphaerales bacterium]|tara:strand:+ start:349 stop:744 length:396 start_codon:yes stop_codon:yes gene_type:complete
MTQSLNNNINTHPTGRLNVLLVEDSFAVAQSFTFLMEEYGWHIIGPAPTVEAALELIDKQKIDTAVLDINLQGQVVTPVAEKLQNRQIPFIFLTGYGSTETMLPESLRDLPTLLKPVNEQDLLNTIDHLLK